MSPSIGSGDPAATIGDPGRLSAVLVSGAPGSGKTTVGALVARRLRAALLDLDTATAGLTAVIGDLQGSHDLDDPALVRLTRDARYDALLALAADSLAVGVSTVLVAPFTSERRDPATWAALQRRLAGSGAGCTLVWLRISADEVRRRVGDRGLDRDVPKLAGDWPAGLDLDPPTVPHLAIDARLPADVIAEQVLAAPWLEARDDHDHDA